MVNVKALTLKTVKSQDNCADLGTKTLAAGTLTLLRNLNGLGDKNAMDSVPCGVQAVTISAGESRMLRATALKVLERTLDEIAWNDQVVSRGDRNNMGSLKNNRFIISACIHNLVSYGHHLSRRTCFITNLQLVFGDCAGAS